jgi:hypothetical protein
MSGLLRRIRGARAAAADPAPVEGAAWSEQSGEAHAHDHPTGEGGVPALPAGVDLDALVGERPTTQRRSRLRRRLRHLCRVREVLLRDLGGLVLEVHRSGHAGDQAQSELIERKLARLNALTTELHQLEGLLGDRRGMVLREPGIGGTCPACGELFGSEARFCWACGTPVAPGARRPVLEAQAPPADLPAIGAPAKEGVPSHEWQAPEPDPGGAVPSTQAQPPAPGNAPTRQLPHVDGSGEEIRPGDPLIDRRA